MEKIQNEAVIFFLIFFLKVGIDGSIVGFFKPNDLTNLTEKKGDNSSSNLVALGLSNIALEKNGGCDLRQNLKMFVEGRHIHTMEMFL